MLNNNSNKYDFPLKRLIQEPSMWSFELDVDYT